MLFDAAMPPDAYKRVHVRSARLFMAQELPEAWADDVIATVQADSNRHTKSILRHPMPASGEGDAFVKVYRRRPNHKLPRLLKPGRAAREGNGYLAFVEKNIPVPPLLLWGESRTWGLFEMGVIVTARIEAPTIAEAYAEQQDPILLENCASSLGRIHAAGLAHGDPLLRNFFATKPHPTPFDLPSWGRLNTSSRNSDLVRWLGSLINLGVSRKGILAMLDAYARSVQVMPLNATRLLKKALRYAEVKKEQ